jgi:hypothetical protein
VLDRLSYTVLWSLMLVAVYHSTLWGRKATSSSAEDPGHQLLCNIFLGALILGFYLVSSHWSSGCRGAGSRSLTSTPYSSDPFKYLDSTQGSSVQLRLILDEVRGNPSISHHDICHFHKSTIVSFFFFSINFSIVSP